MTQMDKTFPVITQLLCLRIFLTPETKETIPLPKHGHDLVPTINQDELTTTRSYTARPIGSEQNTLAPSPITHAPNSYALR